MTLLAAILRYLRMAKMPPSRFGREAVNDPRLVADLKRGRVPGPDITARVRAYLDGQREGGR